MGIEGHRGDRLTQETWKRDIAFGMALQSLHGMSLIKAKSNIEDVVIRYPDLEPWCRNMLTLLETAFDTKRPDQALEALFEIKARYPDLSNQAENQIEKIRLRLPFVHSLPK